MFCSNYIFTGHAIERMFSRNISIFDSKIAIEKGEVFSEYPNDKPYPSFLILGFVNERPIHIVLGKSILDICIIITVYEPDKNIWNDDFKSKK